MKKISAEIVADSIDPRGSRITSYILTYPRFIHGELITHRMFSRNSASSRAIPFNKMVKMVEEDPFIPIAWQKDHKGMQGSEYITDIDHIKYREELWLQGRDCAVQQAKRLSHVNVTKQLCNRLLEPFMWHTVLVTATSYENFFELRCPQYKHTWHTGATYYKSKRDFLSDWDEYKELDINWFKINESQAEIHIQALAESMWDARNESTPKELKPGEWHIPFGDKFDWDEVLKIITDNKEIAKMLPIKIATARCARLSYMTFDGEINYEKDIKLHDKLLESKHMSPFEHCAKVMTDKEYAMFIKGDMKNYVWDSQLEEGDSVTCLDPDLDLKDPNQGWCNNFRGFIPYRYLIENNMS